MRSRGDEGATFPLAARGPLSSSSASTESSRQIQAAIAADGTQSAAARLVFQRLHKQYLPFTYALASRKSHPDDVEDILQETWVAVWRRLQDPEPVERFLSLLEAICRHKLADANERRYRRKRRASEDPWILSLDAPVDPSSPDGARWADALESNEPAPETALLERERMDELWTLMQRLPESWRLAVTYRFFNQMSVAETARAMGVTDDAIKKYVFRAVRRLRGWMQNDTEFWLS
ncbi:MAG TPA: sigma-70 family RNA polymerase sigma factor [Armatimonadota bacterium]|nr:sigma-70 family RNA polymerase sigma factor [Armatimonadota bacterium]